MSTTKEFGKVNEKLVIQPWGWLNMYTSNFRDNGEDGCICFGQISFWTLVIRDHISLCNVYTCLVLEMWSMCIFYNSYIFQENIAFIWNSFQLENCGFKSVWFCKLTRLPFYILGILLHSSTCSHCAKPKASVFWSKWIFLCMILT